MTTQPMEPSFQTACLIGEGVGYHLEPWDWDVASQVSSDAFHGPNFSQKFDWLCATVVGMGFRAIDIWHGHLDPARASDAMINEAIDILKRHGLQVVGYTAGMMRPNYTIREAERNYQVAKAIGAPLIGLRLHPSNERLAFDLGREYGIKYAIENHPEHTPQEVLARIGDYGEWIGITQDTMFWAKFDYDAIRATHELKDHLIHMHLSQMKPADPGYSGWAIDGKWVHCAYKDGALNINGIVQALHEDGYKGAISIELESTDHSPIPEVVSSLKDLKSWLQYLGYPTKGG